VNIAVYRASQSEQERTANIFEMMPRAGEAALDIGARDGHFSHLMAIRFKKVVALDLERPEISHSKIQCVKGNATALPFRDGHFDFVFCAEVLEHIPMPGLGQACREIERVASRHILVGVPYKQDIRLGRTTCSACGKTNPPWGHVNTFDEESLAALFKNCDVEEVCFVETTSAKTNFLSAALMNFAGNPYGTYNQEEPCIHCGARLGLPANRNFAQCIATKIAFWIQRIGNVFAVPRGNWIHIMLRKKSPSAPVISAKEI
jgi:hypothetical protein